MGCIYGDELHFLSIFTFVCAVCLDILIKILVFQRTNKFGGLLILLGILMGMTVFPIDFYCCLCQKGSSVTAVKHGHCL